MSLSKSLFPKALGRMIILCAVCVTSFQISADISGNWASGSQTLTISKCGPAFCGTLSSGKAYFKDMQQDGDKFAGGQVYATSVKKMLDGKMELLADGDLKISSCIANGIICRKKIWKRN